MNRPSMSVNVSESVAGVGANDTVLSAADAESLAITQFAPALLEWFARAGRKELPWQRQRTAYRVWISEIMLQQTQVATVIPYFERFMQRFPDVHALAGAPLDEVLHLWTGLGYYARARNLHRAAQRVVAEQGGEFPLTPDALEALPGIGRSTAAAILAQTHGLRHAILDGNVKRVLARCFGVAGFPGEKKIEQRLWALAEACTPAAQLPDYTQAIMDMGSLVCSRTRPRCTACPLQTFCVAHARDLQAVLPTPRPKKVRPRRQAYAAVLLDRRGAILLQQRPPAGLWGGLWVCPQFDTEDALRVWMKMRWPHAEEADALPTIDHAFTHFDLTLYPWCFSVNSAVVVAEGDGYCWYDPRIPARIGLAKPAVDIIQQIQQRSLSRECS